MTLRAGDKVRVNNNGFINFEGRIVKPNSSWVGKIGTIIGYKHGTNVPIMVKFDEILPDNDDNEYQWFNSRELDKVG